MSKFFNDFQVKIKIKGFVIFSLFVFFLYNFSFSNEAEKIRQQIFYIKQKVKEKKTKLYYQSLAKKDIEEQLNRTLIELEEIKYKIHLNQKLKKDINQQIEKLSSQIKEIKQRINEISNILETKIRLFIKYDVDFVFLLLSSKSSDEFLDNIYVLINSIRSDIELLKSLNYQRTLLIKKNQQIIDLKNRINELDKKLEQEKKYYTIILNKRQKLLEEYSRQISKTKQDIEYYETIQKEKYEELQRYVASNVSRSKVYRGGRFLWPTNSTLITSYFGYRVHPIWGTTRFHSGIDIGASYGSPIYAAADGIVIYSGWYYGYGYTVVIDHGSGISTLYAHCSSLNVYKGQSVKRGQIIAFVGSTGNSTGPHLHFEVQINGKPVNPLNYL